MIKIWIEDQVKSTQISRIAETNDLDVKRKVGNVHAFIVVGP